MTNLIVFIAYIEFNGMRLYSTDYDLTEDNIYIMLTGLKKEELKEVNRKISEAELVGVDTNNIIEEYNNLEKLNREKLKENENDEKELLKKFYPEFYKELYPDESETNKTTEESNIK